MPEGKGALRKPDLRPPVNPGDVTGRLEILTVTALDTCSTREFDPHAATCRAEVAALLGPAMA